MKSQPFTPSPVPIRSCALCLVALVLTGLIPTAAAPSEPAPRKHSGFVIDVWNTEHGLPQNEITAVLQTRDGYLWLGTLSGLVRFDGIRFTVFDESNTPGLASSRILSLFEDSQGRLWVGTAGAGVVRIQDGQVTETGIGVGRRDAHLAAACEDPGGAIWLHLANGQLWRYQDGQTNMFLVRAGEAIDYRGLIAEQSGRVWVGTDRGLSTLNWKAASHAPVPSVDQIPAVKLDYLLASRDGGYWLLSDRRIQKWQGNREGPELDFDWYPWGLARLNAACEDQEGNLIVGTLGAGLFWFNARGEVTRIDSSNGLASDHVLSLHVDREGDLWVGTDGDGLNRLKRPIFDVLEPSRVVQAAAVDDQGGIWIAYNGRPLSYWKEGVLHPSRLEFRTVFVDSQQRVWGGTKGAGLLQVSAGSLKSSGRLGLPVDVPGFDKSLEWVSAIHQDRRGWLWVGTQQGLAVWNEQEWRTFTTRDGLTADAVQAIADDPSGAVWLGTEGGGLNRWQDGQFTSFRKQPDGLPSNNVSALLVDEEGVLWIGTDGGGLARFYNGQWARFTRSDGLVSNSIGYLIEDDQGYLWIGSNAGLMRVPKTALNDFALGASDFIFCRVYGKPDGLPVRECSFGTQPGPSRDGDGRLFFPTIKGLASIQPAELKINTNPPPVQIEAVLVDGRSLQSNGFQVGSPRSLVIPAGREQVEIQYGSLNLAAPDRARFRYRLEGHQTAWTEAGNTRVALYSKLPPGDYRFQVIASNQDGVWNEAGATLAFAISPPFWRTWWFVSASAMVLLGSVTALVHYFSTQKLQRQLLQLRQREALEKERSRIARDIHDQLGASLTQVALLGELVESDKEIPEEIEGHARQISQTARETTRVLDEIVWAVNPANDTLEGLMTYICKYTQEYLTVAGLHYRLDMPGQLPATPLPPEVRHNVFLASKEAVTNVVRHAQATAVWVRVRLKPGGFVLEFEDNGRGLAGIDEKAAQSRNGLRNMRKRMEEVGGDFGFAPAADGGTLVRLTVPLEHGKTASNL